MLRRFLYPIASGALLAFCYPPGDLGIVAWFAIVPFLISIDSESSARHAFGTGYLFGFILHLVSFHWLINLPVPIWISLLGITALTLFSSIYTGLFSALSVSIRKKLHIPGLILYPPVWLAMEFIRGAGILGFPWLDLAYTQHKNLPLLQISSITGHCGVSLLVISANSALLALIKNLRNPFSKELLTPIITVAALTISLLFWGNHRIEEQKRAADSIAHVLLFQGNLSPAEKWLSGDRHQKISLFCDETLQAVRTCKNKPDIVIWPETAVPAYLLDERRYRKKVLSLSAELSLPILTGTLVMEPNNRSTHYNGLVLFPPDGEIGNCYKKIKLVPFGEMIPFEDRIPLLSKIELGQGSYSPGSEYTIFNSGDVSFGGVICFESLFPSHFRRIVKQGAQFMVVVTNDAWFGESSAPYHHAAVSSFRAIENCVSVARCANTGISCIVDPWGRIYNATGIFTREIVNGDMIFNMESSGKTFYCKFGNIIGPAALIMTFILLIFARYDWGKNR